MLAIASGAAAAQEAPVTPLTAEEIAAAEAAATASNAQGSEEFVVVGSRLRRDTYNSASPIQVITREETTLAGYSSTAEQLQGTAVTGGSAQINNAFGGFVTNGGPGANTLSLRGLGAGRSLVLINGRRVAPAGTRGAVGSADLNVLPNAMIDRIEVLRDGASSIYGSDAIAGVVNVITRQNIEGLVVEGQYNHTHNGNGDRGQLSLVGGMTGDRWQVSGSAEIYEREGLALGDRDWTQCNIDNRINRVTGNLTDYIDPITGKPKCYPITGTGSNGVTINTIGTPNATGVGAVNAAGTTFNRWRPNSAVPTGVIGYEGVGGGLASNLNIRDTFDPKMYNRSLISGAKVLTAFIQGSYDVGGGHEVYAEALVNRRESEQTGYRQLSLDYNFGSPLIPENLRFANPFLGPTATSGGRNVGIRAFIGFGNDQSEQEVDFYKFTGGFRGDLGFSDWKYDVNLSYSKSDARYKFDSWLSSRLAQSLNVVEAPAGFTGPVRGGLTCAINLVNPAENCIPAPPLTSQTVGGVLPQDWKDYTFLPIWSTTEYDETVFSAGVDGSLFEIWDGNKVTGFFGVEYRKAKINDTPNIESQNGNLYNLTSAAITRGEDSVWEAFTEIEVPLLKGLPGAEELTINVSARYTDYDSYGSDWTYKVGGLYKPVEWFSLRSTYGTSYRAPALFEQFQGGTSGFLNQQNDPCNNWNLQDPQSARYQNCQSEGLPAGFTANQSLRVITAGGADQGLAAETSDNLTVGAVLDYDFEEYGRFSFAVDYYNIEINNGVSRVGAGNIIQLCYDDPQFRAGGGYCRFIDPRDSTTNGLTIYDSYTNIATVIVEGIDYNLRWRGDVGPGSLLINAQLTQYLDQKDRLFADDEFDEYNGTINNPEYTGTLDLTYTYQGFKVRYGLEWIEGMDSFEYLGVNEETTPFQFRVPHYFLHHASVQYTDEESEWSATFGIRNIADQDPPQTMSSGYYNLVGNAPLYSGYDYVGRQFFVNISKGF